MLSASNHLNQVIEVSVQTSRLDQWGYCSWSLHTSSRGCVGELVNWLENFKISFPNFVKSNGKSYNDKFDLLINWRFHLISPLSTNVSQYCISIVSKPEMLFSKPAKCSIAHEMEQRLTHFCTVFFRELFKYVLPILVALCILPSSVVTRTKMLKDVSFEAMCSSLWNMISHGASQWSILLWYCHLPSLLKRYDNRKTGCVWERLDECIYNTISPGHVHNLINIYLQNDTIFYKNSSISRDGWVLQVLFPEKSKLVKSFQVLKCFSLIIKDKQL